MHWCYPPIWLAGLLVKRTTLVPILLPCFQKFANEVQLELQKWRCDVGR